jgi:hypothetical protein
MLPCPDLPKFFTFLDAAIVLKVILIKIILFLFTQKLEISQNLWRATESSSVTKGTMTFGRSVKWPTRPSAKRFPMDLYWTVVLPGSVQLGN